MTSNNTTTVGVDGGQSTIRAKVSGCSETLTTQGTSHLESHTTDDVADTIGNLVSPHVPDRPACLVAGLTSVPEPGQARSHLARRLADTTGAAEVWLAGDEVTAHVGAFTGGAGVVLAAGTGVACFVFDPVAGTARHLDGAGYLVGDEGGGFWIGAAGIRAAIGAHEGRGPATMLVDVVGAKFGALDTLGMRLHANRRAVDVIAQCATLVLDVADCADGVANAILNDAATRLATTAIAATRTLERRVPIALDGRLLSQRSQLAELVLKLIEDECPDVEVRFVPGASLDGACQLASSIASGGSQACIANAYADLFTVHRNES